MVDAFRTPHTEKLHVVERWHLIDGGKMLEVNITVDDPDTFNRPWTTYQRYQRGRAADGRGHLRREQHPLCSTTTCRSPKSRISERIREQALGRS